MTHFNFQSTCRHQMSSDIKLKNFYMMSKLIYAPISFVSFSCSTEMSSDIKLNNLQSTCIRHH